MQEPSRTERIERLTHETFVTPPEPGCRGQPDCEEQECQDLEPFWRLPPQPWKFEAAARVQIIVHGGFHRRR